MTKANYIANEMGIDTISLGGSIACAMELSEKGYLPEEDVGIGRKLKFGDAHALVELAKMAGERTGFGHLLSQGSLRLATKYGHPELAMVSKGQETAGYEPRGAQGMGLAYATSPIGASHMRGETAYSEILSVPIKTEPLGWRGKAKMCKDFQDNSCIIDSAGLCVFFSIRALVDPTNLDLHPVGIVGLLNAVTGADYTVEELEKVGERIFNAERKLVVRMGFSRKDDTLPKRFTHESMPFGAAKGSVVHLDEMLNEYYQLRGWTQDGIPTEDKLRELGI